MNTSTLPYFAWKEIRQLSPVLLVLGLFVGLSILAYHALGENALPFVSPEWVWYASSVFCALSGLLIGVTTFAIEKETGTFDFLSNLPIPTHRLVSGKLLPRLVATTLFAIAVLIVLGLTCLSTQSFAQDLREISLPSRLLRLSILIVLPTVELFAWGAFFSALTNRTLAATILAAFAGSLVVQLTQGFISPDLFNSDSVYQIYMGKWELRIVMVVVVLIFDLFLAARWSTRVAERSTQIRLPGLVGSWPKQLKIRIPLVKLTWQTIRQSSWALTISAFVIIGLLWLTPQLIRLSVHGSYALAMPWIAIAFAIMGLSVFWDDQRKNAYQFFQQHAEYGRSVCFVRMLVWLTLFAVSFLSLYVLCSLVSFPYMDGNPSAHFLVSSDAIVFAHNWFPLLSWCLGCFAIGAYFSMFCRSLVLAPVFAMIAVGIFSGWVYLVFEMFIGFWWSVLPIALSLFLAMFLHSPSWITNTKRTRAILSYSLMHMFVIVAMLIGVVFYRYHEVKQAYSVEVWPTEARWKNNESLRTSETLEEYKTRIQRDFPELAPRLQHSMYQVVYQDEVDAAIQARTTILLAADKIIDNWPKVTVALEIDSVKLSDEQLQMVLNENQESLDLLATVDFRQIMPTFSDGNSRRENLRVLLLAKAESELREGKLIESIRTLRSLSWILSQAFYTRKRADFNSMLDFVDRWIDHPEHTLESYKEGIGLAYYTEYSTNFAWIDLQTRTDLELARQSGRAGLSPLFFERERNRRLDETHFVSSHPKSENRWLARSLPRRKNESNPIQLKQMRSSPSRPAPIHLYHQRLRSEIQQRKLALKYVKLEKGKFPISLTTRNDLYYRRGHDWEYRNEGLEHDVYVWDGDEVNLLVQKNKAFFLNAPSDKIRYERWEGIPNPRLVGRYIVHLKDGTQLEIRQMPHETFTFDSTTYVLSVNGETMRVPVASVEKIVDARELAGEEPTYLIHIEADVDLKATILE